MNVKYLGRTKRLIKALLLLSHVSPGLLLKQVLDICVKFLASVVTQEISPITGAFDMRTPWKVLILDDMEERHIAFKKKYKIDYNITSVYTAAEAIKALQDQKWDFVFLDHDLGGTMLVPSGKETGYEVAEYIANNPETIPNEKIILHSLNFDGRRNMINVLRNVNIEVLDYPFAWR